MMERKFNLYDGSYKHDPNHSYRLMIYAMIISTVLILWVASCVLVFDITKKHYESFTRNDTISVRILMRRMDVPEAKDVIEELPSNGIKYVTIVSYAGNKYEISDKLLYKYAKKHMKEKIKYYVKFTYKRNSSPEIDFIEWEGEK